MLLILLPLLSAAPSLPVSAGAGDAAPVAEDRPDVATRFVQVSPVNRPLEEARRTPDRARAVLLIHGLRAFAVTEKHAVETHFHRWQKPGSEMVKALDALDSDVYAFSYGQNVPVEAIVAQPSLLAGIASLRSKGYSEVVVIGHSAGGVIARELVEDHPDSGVTRVIQVCAPNAGAKLARAHSIGRDLHEPFLRSLSDDYRKERLAERADKKIPDGLPFVVVVGDGGGLGDFVVSDDSQWPPGLRAQGIPAVQIRAAHFTAVRAGRTAAVVADLVSADLSRIDDEEVRAAREEILGGRVPWGKRAAGSDR